MFNRKIQAALIQYSKFPIVGLFGPRQSGKTTIAKLTFSKHKYLNFEHPGTREFAATDPERFLTEHENEYGLILDEFQHVPQILSYLQIIADTKNRPGYFVITGSQNFLMNQAVTQSLAGRIGILTLLPLSISELKNNQILPNDLNQFILNGSYPRIYSDNFTPIELYPSYIHSYVERDVRQLVNINSLRTFQKFMQLCAGRTGQLLNISDLCNNTGINRKTAESWLAILEASYIIFFLRPYWENFNKRVTKTPKLYFYDTGLAASLLDIKTSTELTNSVFRGALFESLIISDLYKQYFNLGQNPPLYFWRDKNGEIEVDCLINKGGNLKPIEIKAGQTSSANYFKTLNKWCELTNTSPQDSLVVYGGLENQTRSIGKLISWQNCGEIAHTS
jgi:uncharacterized protein